jgi:hypothetical protein
MKRSEPRPGRCIADRDPAPAEGDVIFCDDDGIDIGLSHRVGHGGRILSSADVGTTTRSIVIGEEKARCPYDIHPRAHGGLSPFLTFGYATWWYHVRRRRLVPQRGDECEDFQALTGIEPRIGDAVVLYRSGQQQVQIAETRS